MGGSMWRVEDRGLSAQDGGEALVAAFIEEHPHDDFTLSIYDTITQSTVEILCPLSEMPRIVAFVYHLEKATPLEFIGENLLSDSYVVGMPLTRGRISVGTLYRAEDGKLAPLVV